MLLGKKTAAEPKGNRPEIINGVRFTYREIDIISCLVNLKKNKKIAAILSISSRTAETHIKNIMAKLGCNSQAAILDLIEKSGNIPLLKEHYLRLLIKSAFEQSLERISRLTRKNIYCFFKYDSEKESCIILLKKHLEMSGINLANNIENLSELTDKQLLQNDVNYLLYFLPDKEVTEDNINNFIMRTNVTVKNIIFLVNNDLSLGGGNKGLANAIAFDLKEGKEYYSGFFKILKSLLPDLNFGSLLVEFEELIANNNIQAGRNNTEIPLEEVKEYITEFIDKKIKGFSKLPKIGIIFSGVITVIVLCIVILLIIHNNLITRRQKIFQEEQAFTYFGNTWNKGYAGNINQNIKLLDYLPFERVKDFTGKIKEMEKINQKLEKYGIAVLHAFAGSGKTALAVEYGYRQKSLGTTVRWIYAGSTDKLLTSYYQLAKELGIINYPNDPLISNYNNQQKQWLVRNLLVEIQKLPNNVLLIFDNVENYGHIKDILINLPKNIKVLITTQLQELHNNSSYNIRIEPFTELEATEYLKKTLADKNVLESDVKALIAEYKTNGGILPLKLAHALSIIHKNNRITIKDYILNISKYGEFVLETKILSELSNNAPLAWQTIQYAAYLDSDFMTFEIFDNLLGQKIPEKEIEYLKSHLLMEVTHIGDKAGFRVHRLIRDSFKKYIESQSKCTLRKQEIIVNLLTGMDKMLPYLNHMPDKNWQQIELLVPHVIKTLALYEYIPKDSKSREHLVNLYNKLGFYNLRLTSDFKQALEYFKQALKIRQKIYKGNNPYIAESFYDIAKAYYALGDYESSLEYHQKALEIRYKLNNSPNPDIAESLHSIARIYYHLGDYKQSATRNPLQTDDINIITEKFLYEEHTKYYEKALEYCRKTLTVREQLYDSSHPLIAYSYNCLGNSLDRLGNYEKALEFHQKALEIKRKIHGDNHPYIAYCLNCIADVYNNLKNYPQALIYYKKVLKIRQTLYKANHPNTAYSLYCIGNVYYQLKDYKNSLKFQLEALEGWQNLYADSHPDIVATYKCIGNNYYELKDYKKAFTYYKHALKIREKTHNTNHPDIIDYYYKISMIYGNLGDHGKKIELLGRIYLIYNNLLGNEHSKTKKIRELILQTSPDFISNLNSGTLIKTITIEEDEDTIAIKEKIQKNVLNSIQSLAGKGEWSNRKIILGDTGVKGYTEEKFLKKALGNLASADRIEKALMLCFEAINLGIMHSNNKDFTCAKEFAKAYPKLIEEIDLRHPGYFVDTSRRESCSNTFL